MEWQPIETATKVVHENILVYDEGIGGVGIAYWTDHEGEQEGEWVVLDAIGEYYGSPPDFWMPLPEPPK